MKSQKEHWENIFGTRDSTQVGWYQKYPTISLELLAVVGAHPSQAVVDVGCGTSTLVDELIKAGYHDITLLDLSQEALAAVKHRLGEKGNIPDYICGDITRLAFEKPVDIWHDRAVFHFLLNADERRAYMGNLESSLSKSGRAVIGTFSLSGPTSCSGLEIVQYDSAKMKRELGSRLELVDTMTTTHITPGGREQDYMYFIIRQAGEKYPPR